jgi:hypothetical protein
MNLTHQDKPLLMEWCLKCHRDPESALRPREEVFSMTWRPEHMTNQETGKPYTQRELGHELKEKHKVRDAVTLTSCSICHR